MSAQEVRQQSKEFLDKLEHAQQVLESYENKEVKFEQVQIATTDLIDAFQHLSVQVGAEVETFKEKARDAKEARRKSNLKEIGYG